MAPVPPSQSRQVTERRAPASLGRSWIWLALVLIALGSIVGAVLALRW